MPEDNVLTQKRLQSIFLSLDERDKELLSYVRQCRYMTASQIWRLLFADSANMPSGLRAANRCLNKLHAYGLVDALARPVGGTRAGSKARAWFLTDGGERLLRLGSDDVRARKRAFEPSPFFLLHTIGVAECLVQLKTMCSGNGLSLTSFSMEPKCWRKYYLKGKENLLRPDMFAVTECDKFEDRWFFEIDLRTEAPIRIVEKCRSYHDYRRSGLEQKQHEVFPLVVWIVLDQARKESLVSHIQAEFRNQPKIFTVITPAELEPLIRQGVDGSILC